MTFNGKEIGKDRFEKVDIQELDDKQLIDYQIAVMQWCREGGELEVQYHDDDERLSIAGLLPCWNWEMVVYFPVPKLTYKERQAKWVEDNDIKVGQKVKCLPFTDNQDGSTIKVRTAKEFFNQTAVIEAIYENMIRVSTGIYTYSFPYFALEPIKSEYKPYEKADPAWLVKTDEVMKVKNEDWFTRVAEINNTIKCDTDKHLAIRTASGWLSVDEAFNCYEWYSLATGETRPFGELLNTVSQEKSN